MRQLDRLEGIGSDQDDVVVGVAAVLGLSGLVRSEGRRVVSSKVADLGEAFRTSMMRRNCRIWLGATLFES